MDGMPLRQITLFNSFPQIVKHEENPRPDS